MSRVYFPLGKPIGRWVCPTDTTKKTRTSMEFLKKQPKKTTSTPPKESCESLAGMERFLIIRFDRTSTPPPKDVEFLYGTKIRKQFPKNPHTHTHH